MLWLENLLSQATLERLGWTLVHFLWQAAVVAMLLAVFLRLLRKSSANLRYLAACSALLLMVVLPVATMQFIEVPGPAAEAGPLPTASSAIAPPTAIGVVEEMAPLSQTPDSPQNVNPATAIPWNERIASVLEPALPYVVLGWLAGVFGLSAWHLGGWMQLQRLKRRMVHGVGTALQHRLVQIAHRLGVHRAVTLLESALIEVPTVVGWLRPVILLPASALTGLSPEQLEAILAHELAHIRRYDYLTNVLQTIVEILGFYHPAVWWVSRRIRIERENCCDDMAVRVCGDSVRYARALTCLEEIRHGSTDLAMAATGGNLLDRIARLLGRPATDDRRFAWLPGLITLLLVIGIMIPAALALTAAELPQGSISPAEDMERPYEPRQVLLDFLVAQIAPDEKLDHDTAVRARALLADATAAGDPGVPSVEELQQPLSQVIEKYVTHLNLIGDNAGAFTDLLISKGHAKVLTSPRLLTYEGQRARITTGEDPNRAPSDASTGTDVGGFSLELEVTPTIQDDPNAILLAIGFHINDFVMVDPVDGKVHARAKTVKFKTSDAFRNNQCKMYPLHVAADPGSVGTDIKLDMLLLQIEASVVNEHGTASVVEPNMPAASVRTQSADEPNAAEADKAQVQVGVKIVKVADSSELDRETVLRIEKILGKRVRPDGQAGEFGPRFHLTVGEVLREHVVQQLLPGETMDALLPLFRDMEVLTCPRVVARDGEKCQIRMGNVYAVPSADGSSEPTKLEQVEAGTKLDVTPLIGDHNDVTIEIMVEMTHFLQPSTNTDVPIVTRRSAQATVTTLNNRYIAIAGMTGGEQSVYIMAIPTIVKPPVDGNGTNGVPLGMGGMGGFRTPSDEANVHALAGPVANEQWIQLRMQYVTSDPMYQELARQVAEIERELITDGQKFAPGHPQMIQKQALLYSLKSRTDERKKRLEQEFEDQYTMRGTAPANGKPQVRVEFRVIDVSSKRSLDRKTAVEAADILAWTPLKPKISELQRPLGQILQQYTADGALSGRPLEGFVNLLVSRGYAKQLASPAILVPDGQQARIEIGDNVESLDRVDAGQLAFGVTPKSHPEKDAVLLNLHFEVRRQAESEPQTAEPRTTIEATEAELFAKNAEYVAVPRTAPITWHDKQSNERTLLLMVKPTIVKAAPSPGTAQVPEAPQPIETRRIRLNYIEAGHVISLLSSALQPYVKPEPAGRSGLDSHYLTVTAPRAIVDQIMAEIRQMDIRPRQVLLDARIIAIDPNDLPSLGIDWSLPAPRAEEASGLAPEDANAVNDTSVRRVQIGTALDHASTVSLSAALDAIREDDRLHVLSSPQMVGQDGRVSRLSCILTDGALVPVTSLPVTESGIVISLTPLVGDNNNITLEITTDTEERFSPGPSSDTSVVTRRTTRNAVTIRDGGTVVLTGWTPNVRAQKRELTAGLADSPPAGASRRNDGKDTPPRETVFFLTASLLPEAK